MLLYSNLLTFTLVIGICLLGLILIYWILNYNDSNAFGALPQMNIFLLEIIPVPLFYILIWNKFQINQVENKPSCSDL